MIVIDEPAALEALKHYEIRVARTKFVDSVEDAIAFAERRNAPDPRFMPIVLRRPFSDDEPAVEGRELILHDEQAIRHAYDELLARDSQATILAQEATAAGTTIAVSGRVDEACGKVIALELGAHRIERMVPLDEAAAEALVDHVRDYGHEIKAEHARRMLEHLVLHVSQFFQETGATSFRIWVRLHENGYTVVRAAVSAPAGLHVKTRLAPRAHDRKGDEYHPAGRQ